MLDDEFLLTIGLNEYHISNISIKEENGKTLIEYDASSDHKLTDEEKNDINTFFSQAIKNALED